MAPDTSNVVAPIVALMSMLPNAARKTIASASRSRSSCGRNATRSEQGGGHQRGERVPDGRGGGRHRGRADREVHGERGDRHARPESPTTEEEPHERDPRGRPERSDVLADEGEVQAELRRQVVRDPESDRAEQIGLPVAKSPASRSSSSLPSPALQCRKRSSRVGESRSTGICQPKLWRSHRSPRKEGRGRAHRRHRRRPRRGARASWAETYEELASAGPLGADSAGPGGAGRRRVVALEDGGIDRRAPAGVRGLRVAADDERAAAYMAGRLSIEHFIRGDPPSGPAG